MMTQSEWEAAFEELPSLLEARHSTWTVYLLNGLIALKQNGAPVSLFDQRRLACVTLGRAAWGWDTDEIAAYVLLASVCPPEFARRYCRQLKLDLSCELQAKSSVTMGSLFLRHWLRREIYGPIGTIYNMTPWTEVECEF